MAGKFEYKVSAEIIEDKLVIEGKEFDIPKSYYMNGKQKPVGYLIDSTGNIWLGEKKYNKEKKKFEVPKVKKGEDSVWPILFWLGIALFFIYAATLVM